MDIDNNLTNYNFNSLEDKISHICQNEYKYFLEKSNVIGVGYGLKVINNIVTTKECIKVFVAKKLSCYNISSNNKIPSIYKGILTDVEETDITTTQAFLGDFSKPLTDKVRPVTGGYSIAPVGAKYAGTMGCLVKDPYGIYILGNNHILANDNKAFIGTPIMQPAIKDGGNPKSDVIAHLSRFIPLQLSNSNVTPENYVDCAIAKVTDLNLVSSRITYLGTPQGITNAKLGTIIKKVGKTSGLTVGKIIALHVTKEIYKSKAGDLDFVIKDQILSDLKQLPGDSGSLVLDKDDYAIGLLMGGNDYESIITPINIILMSLGVGLMIRDLN